MQATTKAGEFPMKISDFTQTEADYLEIVCNFTPDELMLFRLRSKGATLDECAEAMHRELPSVKQISRKVNAKIARETVTF